MKFSQISNVNIDVSNPHSQKPSGILLKRNLETKSFGNLIFKAFTHGDTVLAMTWASVQLICSSALSLIAITYPCTFQTNSCPRAHLPSVLHIWQLCCILCKTLSFEIHVHLLIFRDPADVSSESDSAMTSSTVSKLAEARRTTYLSGRWVCDDHNGDTSISITGPWISLPNNGDYSAYYNWVEEKKTTQGPGEKQNIFINIYIFLFFIFFS